MAAVKDSVVIFGGSSNADGSTELFKDETTDTPTAWSTVSYHQKLANHYRFGSVSLDDEVFVFGELKQRFFNQKFTIVSHHHRHLYKRFFLTGGSTFKQDVLKMSRTNLWSVFPQVLRSGRHGFRSIVKGQ